jgi:Beta-propeller repeat
MRLRALLFLLCLLAANLLLAQSVSAPTQTAPKTDSARAQVQVPAEISKQRVVEIYGKLPLRFEANQGQADGRFNFISRGRGYELFLNPTETVLALRRSVQPRDPDQQHSLVPPKVETSVLRLKLVGANAKAKVSGEDLQSATSNYFIGQERNNWRTKVPNYARVHYRGIYPGIDLMYYGHERQIEHDFVLAPGANPKLIRLQFEGAKSAAIDGNGDLVLHLEDGELRLHNPIIYQQKGGKKKEIAGRYILLAGNRAGFEIGKYDRRQPLVIDPVLSYSTYFGGSGNEWVDGVGLDKDGNAFVFGETNSSDLTLLSPYQGSCTSNPGPGVVCNGRTDLYLAKFGPTGTLLWSTYIGGSDQEYGLAGTNIALDQQGNATIAGMSNSPDFPTLHAFQSVCTSCANGVESMVIVTFKPDGTLLYSSFLGDVFGAQGIGVAADASGKVYVSGTTNSPGGFPTAGGGMVAPSSRNAFLAKFDPTFDPTIPGGDEPAVLDDLRRN